MNIEKRNENITHSLFIAQAVSQLSCAIERDLYTYQLFDVRGNLNQIMNANNVIDWRCIDSGEYIPITDHVGGDVVDVMDMIN